MEMVNDLIQHLVSEFLEEQRDLFFPHFLTIKQVEIARDLRNCVVWVALWGKEDFNQDIVLKKLDSLRGDLQEFIGKRIKFKFNPKISFKIDSSGEAAQKIEDILKNLNKE